MSKTKKINITAVLTLLGTIIVIFSCSNEKINKNSKSIEEIIDFEWHKINTFSKPDNSETEIVLWKKNNTYRLEFSTSFDLQNDIKWTGKALKKMEKSISLEKIKEILIYPKYGSFFLKEVVQIEEIKNELLINEKMGNRWANIEVFQQHINKSKSLQKFSLLFYNYGLKTELYHTEKCSYKRNERDELEVFFPLLLIKMKEIHPKPLK